LKPAWTNISQDSISKITIAKWTGGVVQAVQHLLCEALSSKPSSTKKMTDTKPAQGLSSGYNGHHLRLFFLQIPQAGGKADCMVRRVSSQETMWRKSELAAWDCVLLPAQAPACQGTRPYQRERPLPWLHWPEHPGLCPPAW
jgi:hypothetical protein